MTILAAVFLMSGLQRSWAQSAPAPIIYAKASPNSALENRVDLASASRNASVTFDRLEGRSPAASSNPIDLRPGPVKASFGLVSPVSRLEPTAKQSSLASTSVEPYAGPPYQVDGKWYVPAYEPNYDEVGIASWYGPTFHGKSSASGEVFDENAMTAAHPTLPIPSLVRVTNLENGKSVIVRLNDRGPFVDDRIIDLSKKAGVALGMQAKGTAKVRVQYVGPAPAAANVAVDTQVPVVAQEASRVYSTPVIPSQPLSEPAPVYVAQSAPAVSMPALQPVRPNVQRGYFLQAGSFADLGNAHALQNKLGELGQVSVVAADVNGTQFYRVMMGPWSSREEAERTQSRMMAGGVKPIVVARLN